ncbi:hypothetical protein MTO96_035945 [Rhipicephalus appendiculatus]
MRDGGIRGDDQHSSHRPCISSLRHPSPPAIGPRAGGRSFRESGKFSARWSTAIYRRHPAHCTPGGICIADARATQIRRASCFGISAAQAF